MSENMATKKALAKALIHQFFYGFCRHKHARRDDTGNVNVDFVCCQFFNVLFVHTTFNASMHICTLFNIH